MEDLRTQQIEALEVAVPYCAKISNALNNLMEELNGHRQPDTDEYMESALNGLNWIVEVYNGTKDLINKDSVVINKEEVNKSVLALNAANNANDDAARVEALKGLKSFVDTFSAQAGKVISKK